MRPIFITPETMLAEHMRMLEQLHLDSLSQPQCDYLNNQLALFDAYRHLPLGLNPSTRQQFKRALKENHSVTSLGQLSRKLRDHTQRYTWNRSLCYWLSKDEMWSSQSDWWHFKKTDWEAVSPYAYYASEDLRFLNEHVLLGIESYQKAALKEVSSLSTSKNAGYHEHLEAFRQYLHTLENQVNHERHRLAQAMLARLELVAQNQDCHDDDVMFTVSEQLSQQGIDWHQTPLGARPYQTALGNLSTTDFHYFHQFIMHHGSEQQKKRCEVLPWVAAREYVYHKKSQQWRSNTQLIPGIKIPESKWHPNWLFRARNARYEAFHDITNILTVRFASQSASALEDTLKKQETREHKTKDYQKLHRRFTQIQDEVRRIDSIRKKLTPVIHSRSRRELKQYQQSLYQKAEQVALAQLSIVQKAQTEVTTIIDQNDKLDQLLTLADQLSEALSLFPKNYRTSVISTRSSALTLEEVINHECHALKNQIATHKIQLLVLALHHNSFECDVVYDRQKRPMYRLPPVESVDGYFNTFAPYLNPNQRRALYRIQRVMQGHFEENDQVVTYAVLREAASQLVEDPDDILTPLFQQFILPSIISTASSGYQLLLDYEQHHPNASRQRSALLRAVEEEEKISLYAALKYIGDTNPELTHVTQIKMNGRILSMEDFMIRLHQLEPEAIQGVVTPYLDSYRGEEEHVWLIFSVLPAPVAIEYAQKRLASLLEKDDYSGLEDSVCLSALQSHLVVTRSVQKTLLSFLQTVALTDDKLSKIDTLVSRFGDAQQKTLWIQRREQYLLSRLKVVMLNKVGTGECPALQHYLASHPDWLTSESAKQSLADVLKTMRLKGWTEAQHALVNTLSDTTLRQIYMTRLLKRILSDRALAERHLMHLPAVDDTLGRYELMSAPDFRAICENAIQRLRTQTRIEHIDAIRVLESLLSDGLVVLFDMDDLQDQMNQLLSQFKEQLQVDLLAEEVISLIDSGNRDIACDKLQRLSNMYRYYQSIHQEKEQEKATQSLAKIVDAIAVRCQLPITDKKRLLPDEALQLVDSMPTIDGVELLRWRLRHHEALSTLVLDFQNDVLAIGEGKKTTLPSLPLFIEARKRGVLVLLEKEQQAIVLSLLAAKEGSYFSTLPISTQQLVSHLLAHFQGEIKTLDASVVNSPTSSPPIQRRRSRERSIRGKSQHALLITVAVNTDVGRQIIEDMQTSETLEVSLRLIRTVLISKEQDLVNQVTQDLFYYFREVYRISVGQGGPEEALRIHARIQLQRFHYLVDKLDLDSHHLLTVFARHYENIANQLLALTWSLKAIVDNEQRELPELNQLMALCIKFDIIDAELRAQWMAYLTQVILPHITQYPRSVSTQLVAVLPSLLRLLDNKDSVEDRQRIVAYETYYRDVVQASVKQTHRVRVVSSTLPSPSRVRSNQCEQYVSAFKPPM